MGIQGLLPFLDKSSTRSHISEFKGQCAAVDAYCWLHKGAYTCADKLARGEKCDAYVFYCMKYVNMLLSHNIKPILVFDGRHLPAKAGTEKKRRESREANRKTANDLMNAGRKDEARNFFRRCVDITHSMALALIQECRKNNVDCIVAPYEADAQLAYLNLQNIAQVVITEDSDLILFGCSKVFFKLDMNGGGLLVDQDRLHLSMKVRAENFNFDSFRYMCILSGCDYLSSLPGIGLAKALKFISKTRDPEIHRALKRLPSYLNMSQINVSDEYRDAFLHADATFRYQPVFDPRSRSIVPLTEPPEGEEIKQIVDEELPPLVALDLALGNLDPFTLQRMDSFNPDCPQKGLEALQRRDWSPSVSSKHPSIWSQNFAGLKSEEVRPSSEVQNTAIFDMIPMRPAKRPIESEEVILPSPVELVSMYGDIQLTSGIKKHCPSNNIPVEKEKDLSDSEHNLLPADVTEEPSSPVLSNRKSVNPFVKQRVSQVRDVGPVGAFTHPNFFSALRKFDGYNPTKIDSKNIVISRICKETDHRTSCSRKDDVLQEVSGTSVVDSETNKLEDDILIARYASNKENIKKKGQLLQKSVLETMEDIQEETSNKLPKPLQDEGSISNLDMSLEMEETSDLQETNETASSFNQNEFNSRKSLQKLKSSQAVDNTLSKSVLDSQEVVRDKTACNSPKANDVIDYLDDFSELKKENSDSPKINESPLSAFNWSQFVSPKSLSLPKLSNSQTALKTFKNPFRKSKGSTHSAGKVKSFLNIPVTTLEVKSCLTRGDKKSDCPERNTSSENIFQAPELKFPQEENFTKVSLDAELSESHLKTRMSEDQKSSYGCEDTEVLNSDKDTAFDSLLNSNTEAAGHFSDASDESIRHSAKELVPSEDYLWESQKCEEEDEGVLSSPEAEYSTIPVRKNTGVRGRLPGVRRAGIRPGKSSWGTSAARRFGLSRSSTPSSSSQRQNLMTQYGFCKMSK